MAGTCEHGAQQVEVAGDENTYASSFDDGSLAVARSARLELMTPGGNVTQVFDAAEPLVTAPAIGAGGSVWVASNHALYVARRAISG